jgi:hypothetical protein
MIGAMATQDDVRRIALSLPQTSEADHFNAASFRVNKKIFAVLREEARVTLKLDPEDQANLSEGWPGIVTPVTGKDGRAVSAARNGWTFVRYDLIEEDQLANLLKMAWSSVAPRRLVAQS